LVHELTKFAEGPGTAGTIPGVAAAASSALDRADGVGTVTLRIASVTARRERHVARKANARAGRV
jgi:hypothetical protein